MTDIEWHPDRELLLNYAMGHTSPGMELIIATHLTYCPACRAAVAEAEALSGAELAGTDAAEVSIPKIDAVLARLDDGQDIDNAPVFDNTLPYPRPLQAALPGNGADLKWSFRLPGLSEYMMDGYGDEEVSMIRAKPGTRMLAHTHDGFEATLILQGQMADGDKLYRKGDLTIADHHDDHQPHITGDEVCICLVVMSGKLKFTGTFGRALNVLVR